MSVPVIKAITRRIEARMGSGKNAALAAGVSGGLWSQYASDEHPTITIPVHRLLEIAAGDERKALASLFAGEDASEIADLMTEASEVTEGAAALQGMIRLAAADGTITPNERRRIREKALQVRADADDVLMGVG
ncbi:hypothetical protein [Brevundimonas sp.]